MSKPYAEDMPSHGNHRSCFVMVGSRLLDSPRRKLQLWGCLYIVPYYSRLCHNPYPSVDSQSYGFLGVMGFWEISFGVNFALVGNGGRRNLWVIKGYGFDLSKGATHVAVTRVLIYLGSFAWPGNLMLCVPNKYNGMVTTVTHQFDRHVDARSSPHYW